MSSKTWRTLRKTNPKKPSTVSGRVASRAPARRIQTSLTTLSRSWRPCSAGKSWRKTVAAIFSRRSCARWSSSRRAPSSPRRRRSIRSWRSVDVSSLTSRMSVFRWFPGIRCRAAIGLRRPVFRHARTTNVGVGDIFPQSDTSLPVFFLSQTGTRTAWQGRGTKDAVEGDDRASALVPGVVGAGATRSTRLPAGLPGDRCWRVIRGRRRLISSRGRIIRGGEFPGIRLGDRRRARGDRPATHLQGRDPNLRPAARSSTALAGRPGAVRPVGSPNNLTMT